MSAASKQIVILSLYLFIIGSSLHALIPNPIISRGKKVYTSNGTVTYLNDNKYGSAWSVKNNSWIAMNIGSGAKKVFVNLNDPNYAWASRPLAPDQCPNNDLKCLVDYNLLTSSNSTNGLDGQWKNAASIKGNSVTARGHAIDFSGAGWVKIEIIQGGGSIDEVEVFDISKGTEDIWFFAGTSISANTYKGSPPSENFSDLINKAHAGFTPVMIRGGIGCQLSSGFANNIDTYIKIAGNAHFWAIEHGTNDAWGGNNNNLASFRNNLEKVIKACKSAGIEPIIARVIGTNKNAAGWQIHEDYLKCVDELTAQNNLITGPDLFTWFSKHPEGLSGDGIHPNAQGSAKIQQLWAEKMGVLYAKTKSTQNNRVNARLTRTAFTAKSSNGVLNLKAAIPGTASIHTPDGKCIKKIIISNTGKNIPTAAKGIVIIHFSSALRSEILTIAAY